MKNIRTTYYLSILINAGTVIPGHAIHNIFSIDVCAVLLLIQLWLGYDCLYCIVRFYLLHNANLPSE